MSCKRVFRPFQGAAASATPAAATQGIAFSHRVAASPPLLSRIERGETEWLLRFFDLKRDPFADAPEEECFYTNAAIRQVYQELITTIVERPGIAVLTGEAGIGKTILRRRLCNELRVSGHLVARGRAGLIFDELIAAIAKAMRVPDGIEGRTGWLRKFGENVERSRGAWPPVLAIDGAEGLGGDVIANLSKLLAGPADRSLRILLCGRMELATRLDLPVFTELKGMLSASCRLERLADDDAASYIFHRLRHAGRRGSTLFSPAAIDTVVVQAAGLPRSINRLCAQSLIAAAAAGKPIITSEIVEKAAEDLKPKSSTPLRAELGSSSARHNRAIVTTVVAAGIVAAGIVIYSVREQAPDAVALASSLPETGSFQRGTTVTHQMAAIPVEGNAVPRERRSGNAELVRDRSEAEPQLEQAVEVVSDELGAMPAGTSPQPAILAPEWQNSWHPADPCREARVASNSSGRCSNSPDNDVRGTMADGRPFAPENEWSSEPPGKASSVLGTGPSTPVDTYPRAFVLSPGTTEASDLIGQAQATLSARPGKPQEVLRFSELTRLAEMDIENAAPVATMARRHTDTEIAATAAPELSSDAGLGGSGSEEPSAAAETSKTEYWEQAQPEQTSGDEEAVAAESSRDVPPPAGDGTPSTGDLGQVQVADPSELDGLKGNGNEKGSVTPVAAESAWPAETSGASMQGSAIPQPVRTDAAPSIAASAGQQAQVGEVGEAGNASPPEAGPQSSVAPKAASAATMPAASRMPAETMAALMKRGDELLRIGDISAARLAYERAASGGSARAMTALGMTHDPSFLSGANARGIQPDPAIATEWYRRAAALGDAEAAARIQQLSALPR